MMALMGIDIGTYKTSGVLVKDSGEVIAAANAEHTISLPHPGWVEHDAEQVWWGGFTQVCRELLVQSRIDPCLVKAVGVSAIAPCVLPLDGKGKPLRPAILYGIDTRATAEVASLEGRLGRQAIFETCASHLSSQSAGPKILWLRRHEPQVWKRTQLFLTGSGYLVYRLTGEAVLDIYTATAYAPLMDIHTQSWSPLMAAPITPLKRLPRLAWAVEVAGQVNGQASRETGLAEGTLVITGTADAAAEAISAGMAQVGDLMVMFGSSVFFILKTASLVTTERFWGAVFLEKGTYAVAGGISTAGSLTRWFKDQFAPQEKDAEQAGGIPAYQALSKLAAHSQPGARGLVALPYFSGERTPLHDPQARGMFFGLRLDHTRGDLYRALLESVGYAIRHNIEALHSEGVHPQRILAVGGGIKNHLWMQMVSDIAGIELVLPDKPWGACYGDAFLAGIGAGLFPDTSEIPRWVGVQEIIRPDPDTRWVYDEVYPIFRELYQQTAPLMHRLSQRDTA